MKLRKFKKELAYSLKGKVPENKIALLPSGFQRIGNVVILKLKPELKSYVKDIGKIVSEKLNAKTVCMLRGVSGEFRKPKIEVIAGKGTETVHKENNCFYKIDVAKLMFAKGNVRERGRLAALVKPNETVVDMFAGVGYFSIPVARFAKPKKIYAIEKNPEAVKYLKENCRLNKVNIEIINNDCRRVPLREVADRVIMGYLPYTWKFLPAAFGFLKNRGVIHYHDVFQKKQLWEKPREILEKEAIKAGYKLEKILHKKIVKQYSPGIYHVVIDGSFKQSS
jgi:tRNA wybutosine-synthesizing protein 2